MPDIVGVQKWSRCSRHTSCSICRHSAARVDRRAHAVQVDPAALARRRRPIAPRRSRWSSLRFAGMARSRLPSRITSVVWSSASDEALDLVERALPSCSVSKSKSSSRPGASLCPPRPCAPTIGSSVQITLLPATPAIWPKRSPARETARRGARCRADRRAWRAGRRWRRAWAAAASRASVPSAADRTAAASPACSAITYGRDARGKHSSNWTASYTGSNVRIDRK